MKPYNHLIAFFILLLSGVSVQASDAINEYTKKINKEFEVNKDALTAIQNKYGNVEIVSSNRSTVLFEVTIKVEARNQDRADELLDRINVDFTSSPNRVSAITNFGKTGNGWNWGRNNESYQVHYRVELPVTNRLDIDNKYGNVSITSMNSDVKLTLKYGNGSMQDIGGDFQAQVGYAGNCDVGEIGGNMDVDLSYSGYSAVGGGKGYLQSKYSKIQLGQFQSLTIESKYDRYNIERVGELRNEGKYDNLSIEKAQNISVETKYTQIKIESLNTSGRFETGYGSVRIDRLDSAFKELTIDSRYTGYDIRTTGGYTLDIDTEYVDERLPSDLSVNYRDKDSNKLKLKGSYKGGGGLIQANMGYGKLELRQN